MIFNQWCEQWALVCDFTHICDQWGGNQTVDLCWLLMITLLPVFWQEMTLSGWLTMQYWLTGWTRQIQGITQLGGYDCVTAHAARFWRLLTNIQAVIKIKMETKEQGKRNPMQIIMQEFGFSAESYAVEACLCRSFSGQFQAHWSFIMLTSQAWERGKRVRQASINCHCSQVLIKRYIGKCITCDILWLAGVMHVVMTGAHTLVI